MIKFNIPSVVGRELKYIKQVIKNRKFSGDGSFNKACASLLKNQTKSKACFMTPSCTHALELAAIAIDIKPGDEVIMPSFTFTSTANAFVLRGAKIVFVDIRPDTMNIDQDKIEAAITKKTKAIVPVHYAGVACEMDEIMRIAKKYKLYVIEDAAQAIKASYKGRTLGSIGHLGTLSFHETKNIQSGEGGALLVNDSSLIEKIEIIREKGTNRSKFYRGEVDKYGWINQGSSYLLSELVAAYLLYQLEQADKIISDRQRSYQQYAKGLEPLVKSGQIEVQSVSENCKTNYHIFYIKLKDSQTRQKLIDYLKSFKISSVFHYLPLHSSRAGKKFSRFFGKDEYTTRESERLLRLPLYYKLSATEVDQIIQAIYGFFKTSSPATVKEDGVGTYNLADKNFSLFAVIVTVFLGLAYWLCRFGLNNNAFLDILKVWSLSFFILLIPDIFQIFFPKVRSWQASRPLLMIDSILALTIAGYFSNILNLMPLFGLGGFIFLFIFLINFFMTSTKGHFFTTFFWGFGVSLWVIAAVWGTHLLSPLFFEEIIFGNAHYDTLFHTNITNMITTYSIPSSGLDGIHYLNYHWGSHYIFAQLGKLLEFVSLRVYNLAYPVIFVPLFIRSILEFVSSIQKRLSLRIESFFKIYLAVFILLAGAFTTLFFEKIGLSNVTVFVSQSYLVSLTFMFLLLALTVEFGSSERKQGSWSNVLFWLLLIPLGLGLIQLTKSSIGYLLLAGYAYAIWRFDLYKKKIPLISLVLTSIVALVIYRFTFVRGSSFFSLFSFLRLWVDPQIRLFFWFLYYFMAWLFVFLRFRQLKIMKLPDLVRALKTRSIIDLEILTLISLVGLLPGLFIEIAGGSAGYFSELQYWLAMALVLAYLPVFWPGTIKESLLNWRQTSLIRVFAALVIITLFLVACSNTFNGLKELARLNIGIRISLLPSDHPVRREGSLKYVKDLIRENRFQAVAKLIELAKEPQESAEVDSEKYTMIQLLHELGGNYPDKKDTLLFVPQDNYFYWNMLQFGRIQYVAGSLAKMAMLNGVQPFIPKEINQTELSIIASKFSEQDRQTMYNLLKENPQNGNYLLDPNLSTENKIKLYDILSPYYANQLINYSYSSYNTKITEAEYLDATKDNESLCRRTKDKGFKKIIILKDTSSKPTLEKIDCV